MGETDGDLLCAAVQQPFSVGIDGSAWDFQLYTGVSLIYVHFTGWLGYLKCYSDIILIIKKLI